MYIGNQVTNVPFKIDAFNGDASTTSFGPLSRAPASSASIAVYVDGLYKTPTVDYTLAGTQIFFIAAPASGNRNIIVLHLGTGAAAGVVADNTVTSAKLADRSITGPKIGINAISGNNIATATITGNLIAQNSIRANQIVAGTITGNLITANSISGNQIVAGTITGNLIATTSIRGNQIATNTLTGNLFAANTITGDKIGQGAISANNISPTAVPFLATGIVASGVANFQIFTAPGTFTLPATTTRVKLTMVGAGGGSGGVKSGVNETASGGGGGGETVISYINIPRLSAGSVAPGVAIEVGIGGAAGTGTPSVTTAGAVGNFSNVTFYSSTSPGTPRIVLSANGGGGSAGIVGSATPITPGNVNAGSGGTGGRGVAGYTYAGNFYTTPSVPVDGPAAGIIFSVYEGYRGNIGAVDPARTSQNAISTSGLTFGMGTIGAGALGVKVAAPGIASPGLTGANGAVLIEF